jgi:hypothetical protein
MRRNVRRYLRRHFRQRTRRAARPSWLRRYRVPIVAVVLVGVALLYCHLSDTFTLNPMEGSYNRLHYGMTVEEVEDVLGKPSFSDLEDEKIWGGWDGVIVVRFNNRHVSEMMFRPIRHYPRHRSHP